MSLVFASPPQVCRKFRGVRAFGPLPMGNVSIEIGHAPGWVLG